LLKLVKKPWQRFLALGVKEAETGLIRRHERTGRPLGGDAFVSRLERQLGRTLKPQKPGPKREV